MADNVPDYPLPMILIGRVFRLLREGPVDWHSDCLYVV